MTRATQATPTTQAPPTRNRDAAELRARDSAALDAYLHDAAFLLERIERLIEIPAQRQAVGQLLLQLEDIREAVTGGGSKAAA